MSQHIPLPNRRHLINSYCIDTFGNSKLLAERLIIHLHISFLSISESGRQQWALKHRESFEYQLKDKHEHINFLHFSIFCWLFPLKKQNMSELQYLLLVSETSISKLRRESKFMKLGDTGKQCCYVQYSNNPR